MAEIAPLRPLRYDPVLLPRVVSPPYDVIDEELRAELGARHQHNVVHIDLPEGDGDAKYETARQRFAEWQEQGVLVRDEQPAYWRFEQTFDPPTGGQRLVRKGFFALVRAVPFSDRVVLPHERTLKGPKLDRMNLSRATRATLSPQFMMYSDPERALEADLDSGEAFADFTDEYGVRQVLRRVTDPAAVKRITDFLAPGKLYIADGHHRYETAVAMAREFGEAAGNDRVERPEYEYTFALLTNGDDPNLVVFATHRLVHSLASFDFDRLLASAGDVFDVSAVEGSADALAERLAGVDEPGSSIAAVGAGGRAALLTLKPGVDLAGHPVLGQRPAEVRSTAVALLHDGLIEHVLGVDKDAQAAKTNIKYLQKPEQGAAMLERGEGQVLFLLNPTPVDVIRRVSDAGEVMPQKSTFFFPKVPTGLLFHTLRADRSVD